jgi:molybdopterin-binding protein
LGAGSYLTQPSAFLQYATGILPGFLVEAAMLSARNQLAGTVKSVKLGNVMAEVVVTVGNIEIVSVITRSSAESLGLKTGDKVRAIIKSTEVMIDK